jgi:hypothetical protein
MTTLITRSELARRAGVTPGAVTLIAKKRLKDACHGKKIDIEHPSVIEWLNKKQVHTIKLSDADRHLLEHWRADRPAGVAELFRVKDMTIIEVVRRFGTEEAYLNWLKSLKAMEDLEAARLKNDRARGSVIEAELVKSHVMSLIDGTWRRLLSDTSKTIARRSEEMIKAGKTSEELELSVREIISSQLKALKDRARKKLKDAADA